MRFAKRRIAHCTKTMPTTADSGSIELNYFLMTRVARARNEFLFIVVSVASHRKPELKQYNALEIVRARTSSKRKAMRAQHTQQFFFSSPSSSSSDTRDRSVHFNPRLMRIPCIILAMRKYCLFFICVIYSRLSIPPKLSCHCLRGYDTSI